MSSSALRFDSFFKTFVSNCSYLRVYTRISFLYASTLRYFTVGFLFSPFLLTIFFLFNFTFRELGISSASMFFSIWLPIICTEILLFVSFFWGAFASIFTDSYITDSTLDCPFDGLINISSRDLIKLITYLLSSASVTISLGILYSEKAINRNIPRDLLGLNLIAFFFASVQVCEYLGLYLYINDSVLGTYLFTMTGLHFIHVIFGIIVTCVIFWNGPIIYKNNSEIRQYLNIITEVLQYTSPYALAYWHFVEVLWLFIYVCYYTL